MDECKDIVVLNTELHTSIVPSPSVCLEVMYGPTELSKSQIVREINDNFEHWQNAGDHSFIVVDLKLKELVAQDISSNNDDE